MTASLLDRARGSLVDALLMRVLKELRERVDAWQDLSEAERDRRIGAAVREIWSRIEEARGFDLDDDAVVEIALGLARAIWGAKRLRMAE